ncbi:hypothetical protein GCM10023320_39960 [Pseudonocardia adelaidensis]|uniref:Integrase catalytic domain-containing protein n=1 Tax=Pseudonocardia adelaidensis TaxID=648754 RepID=A0ABP9NLH5_9PSEU
MDDHSRPAYIKALPDERDTTCAGFLHPAVAWFRERGVQVLRVLTDNAKVYRIGQDWRAVCVALGIRRRFTKPGCPLSGVHQSGVRQALVRGVAEGRRAAIA